MTDFKVSPSALDSAAGQMEGVGGAVDGVAGGMTPPPPLMCGLLIGPVVSIFAQIVHMGAQQVIKGVAHEDRMISANLKGTAKQYRDYEDDAAAASDEFFGSI